MIFKKNNALSIGSKVKNKVSPQITGEIKALYPDGTALLSISGMHIPTNEMIVCLDNWKKA